MVGPKQELVFVACIILEVIHNDEILVLFVNYVTIKLIDIAIRVACIPEQIADVFGVHEVHIGAGGGDIPGFISPLSLAVDQEGIVAISYFIVALIRTNVRKDAVFAAR